MTDSDRLIAIEKLLITINQKQDNLYGDVIGIMRLMHGTMKEILDSLTAETGGDLAATLRQLSEAVAALGTQVANNPTAIVNRLTPLLNKENAE